MTTRSPPCISAGQQSPPRPSLLLTKTQRMPSACRAWYKTVFLEQCPAHPLLTQPAQSCRSLAGASPAKAHYYIGARNLIRSPHFVQMEVCFGRRPHAVATTLFKMSSYTSPPTLMWKLPLACWIIPLSRRPNPPYAHLSGWEKKS